MEGLYFYKLVSPYKEDVTKDCKLTVNEIDHNFLTLKDADITEVYLDEDTNELVVVRRNGEKLAADLSHFIQDTTLKVTYDSKKGVIELGHEGVVDVIDKLITKDNVAVEIVKHTIADETLCGAGREDSPLGLNPMEKTSCFRAVHKVVDKTKGEYLPNAVNLKKGDRFLAYEEVSEYGYLYKFDDVLEIERNLTNGWRIPTKQDWDNMLNAIELCDEDRNHDSLSCNSELGNMAGSFLKARDKWMKEDCTEETVTYSLKSKATTKTTDFEFGCKDEGDEDIFDTTTDNTTDVTLKVNTENNAGVDKFGMRLIPAGYGDGYQMKDYLGQRGKYWTATKCHVTDVFVKRFDFDKSGVIQEAESPRAIASVRLVKDYNGHNYRGTDTIHGITYNTTLIPTENTSHGYTIWTTANLASYQRKYHPVLPEGGDTQDFRKAFFFCEWDGEDWMKKEMIEGDTVVINLGPDGDRHREYRLVHGKLVNVARDIVSIVIDKYDADIKDLQNRVEATEEDINALRVRDAELEAVDQQIWAAIEEEAKAREEVDDQIWSAIENEGKLREEVDSQIWESIENEVNQRQLADAELWRGIKDEAKVREENDKEIWLNLEKESMIREEVDKQLWKGIEAEGKVRETVDGQIWKAIESEGLTREAEDKALYSAIETESQLREEVDNNIYKSLETETLVREEEDLKLWGGITTEAQTREEIDNQIWASLNAEIERSKAEDELIKGRLINETDSKYSCDEGVLVLGTDDPKNTITIKLNGNYGTF